MQGNQKKVSSVCDEQTMENKIRSKMFKISIEHSKLWFVLFLCGFNIKNGNSESVLSRFHEFDSFERMKIHIFTKSDENFSKYANVTSDRQCLVELNEIGLALTDFQLWATKSNL